MINTPSYRVRDLRPPCEKEPAHGQWNFEIRKHGRIGVYGEGPDGAARLLAFLAGVSARIECPPCASDHELRVAYLSRDPVIDLELDVWGNLNQAVAPLRKTEERYTQLILDPEGRENDFAEVLQEMDDRSIWALDERLEIIATVLDLPPGNAMGGSLSPAERRRVGLGMVLLQQPDIALIDLATEELDEDIQAWVVQHLLDFPGTLLIASDNAELVEQLCNESLIVGRSIEHRTKPRIAGSVQRRSGRPSLYYTVVATPIEKGGPRPQVCAVQPDESFELFLSGSGEMRVEVFPQRNEFYMTPVGWWLNDQPLASCYPVQTGTLDMEIELPD